MESHEKSDLEEVEGLIETALRRIEDVRKEISTERTKRRQGFGWIAAALLIFGSLVMWNAKIDFDQCTGTNEARREIKNSFQILVDASLAQRRPVPPELQERADAFMSEIEASLPEVKCSRLPFYN